jgi:hypothetical protein
MSTNRHIWKCGQPQLLTTFFKTLGAMLVLQGFFLYFIGSVESSFSEVCHGSTAWCRNFLEQLIVKQIIQARVSSLENSIIDLYSCSYITLW